MPNNDEAPSLSQSEGAPVQAQAAERSDNQLTGGISEGQQPLAPSAGILSAADDARRQDLLRAALSYARDHNWRVVPVRWVDQNGHCSCRKGASCTSPGKHPVPDAWQDVATTDADVIAYWWRPSPDNYVDTADWFPQANVGVVTGRGSGIFVLDADTYNGAEHTLGGYERRHGPLPPTRVQSTGSGGTHYFFQYPEGFEVRNSAKKVLGQGLDIRGANGFVVMPPSVSGSGPYEINPAHDIEVAPAPQWLLDIIKQHDRGQRGEASSSAEPVTGTGYARRYAEAALTAEAERVRGAEPGRRNDTLNEAAFSLGTLGGAGLLTEEAAWRTLHEAALACGLDDGEIRPTFSSGWRAGLEKPKVIQWRVLGTDWPIRPRTEIGNADRMADHFGDQLRWCPERATWMVYSAGCWTTGYRETGEWMAQQMMRRLEETEALMYDDEPETGPNGEALPSPRDEFIKWVRKNQTRSAVSAAARLAPGVPLMRISQQTFDADPYLLNCMNGVVDLRTGDLIPHDPEQRMTMQCPVAYDPSATAPRWEEFLAKVQPSEPIRAYLQRLAGYSATGSTAEQAFALHQGSGANGKSVFQEVLAHVLGTYAQTVPVATLMASTVDGAIPNDVARMVGKRWLVAAETKAGKALDEQKLKQLTGGDSISARFMRSEYFDFRPIGKIHMTTNHMPKVSDADAIWRRIHVIIWPVQIPEEERDGDLVSDLIKHEAPGILAWIVEGARSWCKERLCPPAEARDAKAAYRENEDIVKQFITECLLVVDPVAGAIGRSSREIWHQFKHWCEQNGHQSLPQRTLSSRIEKNGFTYVSSNGWRGFPGLQIQLDLQGGS